MNRRKRGVVCLLGMLMVALITAFVWNQRSVRDKIVDYWEEQSKYYTAFTKELTAGTILEQSIYVESISEDKYAYQRLAEEEKQVYDEILYAILNHMEKITVATLDPEVLKLAFANVSSDYGGLFWISGYSYTEYIRNGERVSLEFAPKYTMTQTQRDELQKKLDAEVETFLSDITLEATDYEKASYVFTNLVQQVDYDRNAPDGQNIVSVFLNRKTVCQGYASAVLYLFEKLDIPAAIVTGSANGEAHAWNLMQLDGEYYYMDATWGNSTYLNEESKEDKLVNYSYLAFTTEDMAETHTPDDHMKLPECTADANTYFVHEGLYFTEWKPDEIGDIYAQAAYQREHRATVKFATKDLLNKAKEYFIDQQHLTEYCEIIGNVYYLEDKENLILTISIK